MQTVIKYRILSTIIIFLNFSTGHATALNVDQHVVELMAQYQSIHDKLNNNQFKRPLAIKSMASDTTLKSEVYAIINYPFPIVHEALNQPEHWCDALILHINIKFCRMDNNSHGTFLNLNLGKKTQQSLPQTYKTTLNFHAVESSANYFLIHLTAKDGPLGTYDYDVLLEATPLKDTQTLVHFTYSYAFGTVGRVAMKSYLATTGRDKVGFTVSRIEPDGQIVFIKGIRGVAERNTMRYFLAIDAYLAALNDAPEKQLGNRLNSWFDSTELHKAQLYEMNREEYLEMKQSEVLRQNTLQ